MKKKLFSIFCLCSMMFTCTYGIDLFHADEAQPYPISVFENPVDLFNYVIAGVVQVTTHSQTGTGSGTGIVYHEDNEYLYIITNHHVIDGGTSYEVKFHNMEIMTGHVIGSDSYADVALVRCLKPTSYKLLRIGNSDLTQVGELIYAIGNPVAQGLSFTFNAGMVSGVQRVMLGSDFYLEKHVLQIDVPINPGNSGGPSFNALGEVIGINTVKYVVDRDGTTTEGLNFLLPINEVYNIACRIFNSPSHIFVRPYIGTATFKNIQDIYYKDRSGIELPDAIIDGVTVYRISDTNSAINNLDFPEYSIIYELNNRRVKNTFDLRRILFSLTPGQIVDIKFYNSSKNYASEGHEIVVGGKVY